MTPLGEGSENEFIPQGIEIVPAEGGNNKFENCIVITAGAQDFALAEIASLARQNGAFKDNSREEAGDDLYLVQFLGHEQEVLSDDGLSSRLREIRGDR